MDELKNEYRIASSVLKRKYEDAVGKQKYKDEEKAIKIVRNLYPKLLKAAKKGKDCYILKPGFFGLSEEVMINVTELVRKEGFHACYYPCAYPSSCVKIWGWAE